MRLPRVRFTVRRMMVAVAALSLFLAILLHWDMDTAVSQGVGHVRIPIVFAVLESGSGQSIEGATISLRDRDYDSNPIPPYVLDLKTGPDGRATVLDDWMFYVSTGVPSGKLWFYRVAYPRWEMRFGPGLPRGGGIVRGLREQGLPLS